MFGVNGRVDVLQVPIQIMPPVGTKAGEPSPQGRIKIASGSPFGMNPRPSVIAHWCSSNATLNPPTRSLVLKNAILFQLNVE